MQHQPLLPRRGFLVASALAAVSVAWAAPAVAGRARSAVRLPQKSGAGTPATLPWYDLTNQAVTAAGFPEAITQSRTWAVSWLAAARAVGLRNDPGYATAAFAQALRDTLVAQVPSQQSQLDAALAATLVSIPDGTARQAGIAAGQRQASAVLTERQGDGTDTASLDIPYTPPPPGPGTWQPTPPAYGPALRAGQGNARPFLLATNSQFDPGLPPALSSPAYLQALAEVRAYGSATSTVRTPGQTQVALFWYPALNFAYVQILRAVLAGTSRPLGWQAKLVAAFHAITTDIQIAIYNAKFKYVFWRPVTAIQDGTVGPGQSWTPLSVTPRYPEYPSGHGGYAGAAQQVLTAFLGPQAPAPIALTSPSDPGVTRTYTHWSAITSEVIDARVWEGSTSASPTSPECNRASRSPATTSATSTGSCSSRCELPRLARSPPPAAGTSFRSHHTEGCPMIRISLSPDPGSQPRTRRRGLGYAATVAGAVLPAVLAVAVPVGAAADTAPTTPPPITILTPGADNHNGDIFISPFGDTSTYANGPEIIDNHGHVIWFHPVPTGQEAADFRTQLYHGHRVLTWWQGTGLGGLAQGTDYIYNDHFQQIATVNAGNGYSADGHEFLITPWNTALILAYTTATADLTSIGGPAGQTVVDGIVQEIDIRTGRVLFQWNSADHVPYGDSQVPLPALPSTPWDWFHVNAVHLARDGSLLIDARNTWASYDVNRHTGNINWELGGKHSTFTVQAAPGQTLDSAGEIFAWQHDPEQLGPDTFTLFDNDAAPAELPYSRSVTIQLNYRDKTATLVATDNQPEGRSAGSQGNAQTTRNRDQFIGWGALPYFSEFSPSGRLEFNAEFPAGVNTYRAYRLPWPGSHRVGQRN